MIKKWIERVTSSFRDDIKLEVDRYKSHVYHHFNQSDYYTFLNKKMDSSELKKMASPFPWPVANIPACKTWKELPGHSRAIRVKQFKSLAKTGHRVDLYTFQPDMYDRKTSFTTMDVHYLGEELFWLRILLPRVNGVMRDEQNSQFMAHCGLQHIHELFATKFHLDDGSLLMFEDAHHLTIHIKNKDSSGILD